MGNYITSMIIDFVLNWEPGYGSTLKLSYSYLSELDVLKQHSLKGHFWGSFIIDWVMMDDIDDELESELLIDFDEFALERFYHKRQRPWTRQKLGEEAEYCLRRLR